jgi:hypothetical protein
MAGNASRLRPLFALAAALTITVGSVSGALAAPSGWDGSLDLYRSGSFSTQRSWLWCTAAGVQIVRNIVERDNDHSTSGQRRYFEWMRRHNRYDLPLSAGVDPAGWTAGLRHFVDDRYRLVASKTFDGALRSAVQRMRATNLPVALTVSKGNHGWILTGFSATADPATDKGFKVTSVRVVGPLYGLQSTTYGYDMRPGRSLTTKQFRGFFTPWWYAPKRMIWDGLYVSIQPVPAKAQIAKSLPVTLPAATAASSSAASAAPSASAVPSASASPSTVAAVDPPASVDPTSVAAPTDLASAPVTTASRASVEALSPFGIVAIVALVSASALGLFAISRRRPPRVVR